MPTNPGLPVCPNCGRRFNESDLEMPTFASDFSYIEVEYVCLKCEREGNLYFNFNDIEQYEEEEGI